MHPVSIELRRIRSDSGFEFWQAWTVREVAVMPQCKPAGNMRSDPPTVRLTLGSQHLQLALLERLNWANSIGKSVSKSDPLQITTWSHCCSWPTPVVIRPDSTCVTTVSQWNSTPCFSLSHWANTWLALRGFTQTSVGLNKPPSRFSGFAAGVLASVCSLVNKSHERRWPMPANETHSIPTIRRRDGLSESNRTR